MENSGKKLNREKGNSGEEIACAYLKQCGYRILNRNFTTSIGEIDIVVTDEHTLIFVEVKSKYSGEFGFPSEMVNYHKRNKINQVACQYIKKFRLFNSAVRFDVIEVFLGENKVNHIENAFDSYLRY